MAQLADDPDFQYLAVDRRKIQQEAAPFDAKKNCFIPDEKDGYVRAEIVSTKGEEVICQNIETKHVRPAMHLSMLHQWERNTYPGDSDMGGNSLDACQFCF